MDIVTNDDSLQVFVWLGRRFAVIDEIEGLHEFLGAFAYDGCRLAKQVKLRKGQRAAQDSFGTHLLFDASRDSHLLDRLVRLWCQKRCRAKFRLLRKS